MDDHEEEQLYELREAPGKGYGLFARQSIPPGTIILEDSRLMEIPIPGHEYTEHHLLDAFSILLSSEQQLVLALSIGKRPSHESQLMQIMRSNAFGDGKSTWLHPTICRINHSCVPNATSHHDTDMDDLAQIIAERRIEAGEEITISYNNQMYEICTARERSVLLRNQYGFCCECPACITGSRERGAGQEEEEEDITLSDTRRLLIAELVGQLHGLRLSSTVRQLLQHSYSSSPASTFPLSIPPEDLTLEQMAPAPLTPSQRTSYNLLLAGLRQAEGLEKTDIVNNYVQAADAMVVQLLTSHRDVVILDWARNCRDWMEKAMAMLELVRNPYDENAQTLRRVWREMQEKLRLKLALEFLNSPTSSTVPNSADDVPFALRLFPSTKQIQVLAESECRSIIKQSYEPVSQEDDDEYDEDDEEDDKNPSLSEKQQRRKLSSTAAKKKNSKKDLQNNKNNKNYYKDKNNNNYILRRTADLASQCYHSTSKAKWGAAAVTCLAPVAAAYYYGYGR